jgi:hypothetical protein
VEHKVFKKRVDNAIEAYERKISICEIEDLGPRLEVEWLDHSYIPLQLSTTSFGSSQVQFKIKYHICIEA